MYRQLATLAGAGISPGSSAGTIAMAQRPRLRARNPEGLVARRALEAIKQRTWQGVKLSQAMAEWPQVFPRFHQVLVAEGEITGDLDKALHRLAEITERDLRMHQELRKQTFYPSIVFMVGIPVLIVAFLTQNLKLICWGAALIMIVMFVLLRAAAFLIASMQGQQRPNALRFAMAMPVVGGIARKVSIAYFMRAFGLLQGAGVPLVPSLLYAAEASGNPWLQEPIRAVIPQIEAGRPLREALASTGIFPHFALSMMTTGEMTGNVDSQMSRASNFYEEEIARQVKLLCYTLSLIIMLTVSALGGYIFIMFWKHYYENMIYHPFDAHAAPM